MTGSGAYSVGAVKLEVFKNIFSSICEEMGIVLKRSSFSPNIKERGDFSCAIFTASGEMIAHAANIPVHLGSMPMAVKPFLEEVRLAPGDVGIVNDPFRGGTHLPDVTLVKPVFYRGGRVFFLAVRAHHADVGGQAPGSMANSSEIYQEGLIVPPVKFTDEVFKLFLSNTRNPEERKADLSAQVASLLRGEEKAFLYLERYGEEMLRYGFELIDYGERCMRKVLENIPDGSYSFEDFLDDDGFGEEDIRIKITVRVKGDEVEVDFSGSSREVAGSLNAPISVTRSAVLYVFRSLIDEDIPLNHGIERPIKVVAPEGTVVNATFPSAVVGGNVETSQRIVDALLGALSSALPEKIPAASYGTMSNLSFGNPRFAYYETIGGGMGASAKGDGESAIHAHMTNTKNTPIEAVETYYPVVVRCYKIRNGSGGKGFFKGGDGIVREMEFLEDVVVSVLSDRRRRGPYGLHGGFPGSPGRNVRIREGREEVLPGKFRSLFRKGDVLRIETPGGGGWGSLSS